MLGKRVKCVITGYEGTVVAIAKWLYGCERVAIQGDLDKEGKIPDPVWIDTEQTEIVPKKKIVKRKETDPAGPRANPQRAKD